MVKKAVAGKAKLPFDRVVVLAIGVETYQNPPNRNAIGRVDYAETDADGFVETVRAIYEGDVDVDVHLLKSTQASLTTIRDTTRYLLQGLAPSDLFMLFYAGHGFHGEGDNRLTAFDSNPDNLQDTTLNLSKEILRPLATSPCRRALLFVDACAVELSKAAKGRGIMHDLDAGEIEEMLDEADYIGVFLSCSPGEKSYGAPALKHGVFTAHLLQAFRGEVSDALESDRWLTDVSLRDWITREVKRYVTRAMQVSGQQTPRAMLNSPQSFRIRHVQKPAGPPAVTLADLKLKNRDAYLESVETGPVRSLEGFSTASGHTVPKVASTRADLWIERLMRVDLQAELDSLRAEAKTALAISRRDTNVDWAEGGGTLDTPAFRYTILCDQDPDKAANYRVRRQLVLRDGWQNHRDAIDELFSGTDLSRLVVEIEPAPRAFDNIAETFDDLATRSGAVVEERSAEKRIAYADDTANLKIDLRNGLVELSFRGVDGLAVLDSARRYSLGWRATSPMLPPPATARPQRTFTTRAIPKSKALSKPRRPVAK
jgi:hypothetical protein